MEEEEEEEIKFCRPLKKTTAEFFFYETQNYSTALHKILSKPEENVEQKTEKHIRP